MENQTSTNAEFTNKLKNELIEVREDEFTKVKTIICKNKIKWSGYELRNRFMITDSKKDHKLEMSIDYRKVENTDAIFFVFIYDNIDDGYPHMGNLELYFISDDNDPIKLDNVSANETNSVTEKFMDNYYNIYVETAQVSMPVSQFREIANTQEYLQYSIRFGGGKLNGIFSKKELYIIKGFYNSVFDKNFELEWFEKYNREIEKENEEKKNNKYLETSNSTNESSNIGKNIAYIVFAIFIFYMCS